jgi:hypothetical protein
MAGAGSVVRSTVNQSGYIVAALLGGFVLWLAVQGKLQAYWSLLVGGSGGTPTTPTPTAPSALPGQTPQGQPTTTPPTQLPLTDPNYYLDPFRSLLGQPLQG